MNPVKLCVGAAGLLLLSAFTVSQTVTWKQKENYSVKCIGAFTAGFKGLKATILFNEAHPEKSLIRAYIDARTIDTGNRMMDEHAREEWALYTAKFPLIVFASTAVTKTTDGYEATGNLTLKGVTRQVKLPFVFNRYKEASLYPPVPKETFYGTFSISPGDFNIKRIGAPEQVMIELTIPVTADN